MITYLLKSASCLAILLAFYHLVLEREKMHQFNRFYLLGSVLFSFIAPLYIINTIIPIETFQVPMTYGNEIIMDENIPVETPINYRNTALVFSSLITLILTVRFGLNLIKIFKKVTKNTTIKLDNAILVLVDDTISPHTFWNYIFINKDEYNSHKIEDELFTHELTHVTQRHTFDVLLIEVLKIVFWFNPLFYFLKKSIQLNHEFIADEKVINSFKNISEYQYLLLNKAAWNNDYYLASNLNYSLTKKRLVMMTTKTSKVNNWLKKLAVIPLLTGSVYVFAERVETYEEVNNKEFLDTKINKSNFENDNSTASPETLKDIKEKLKDVNSLKLSVTENKKDSIPTTRRFVNRKKGTFTYTTKDGKTITKKFADLTEEEKKLMPPPPAPVVLKEKKLSAKLFQELKNSKKYAIWIDGKVAKNEVLNNYKNTDFYNYSGSFVHKNARSKRFPQEYQYNLNTKKHILKIKKQLPPPPPPKARKNSKVPKPVKIEVIDKPTKSQKKVKAPKLSKVSSSDKIEKGWKYVGKQTLYYVKNENGTTYYNRWGQEVTKEGKVLNTKQISSNKVIPSQNISKVYKDDKVVSEFKQSNLPPPPPPMSAKELVFRYPKAIFYLNNKEANQKEAKTFVKKHKVTRIATTEKDGRKVIMFLSETDEQKPSKNNKKGKWKVDENSLKKYTSVKGSNKNSKKGKWEVNQNSLKVTNTFKDLDKKNITTNYYLDNKKISKKEYYDLIKSDKDYLIWSGYANKEKSILNMHISKSEEKILALIKNTNDKKKLEFQPKIKIKL